MSFLYRTKKSTIGLSVLVFFSFLVAASAAERSARPNIVVILVDDAALMDFGVYGGEASTPNIDLIASTGKIFSQYRTSPLCSPTRAMLLTGLDNHLTGVATIPELLPEEHRGEKGYAMGIEPQIITLPEYLRSEGYRTLMSGKWHLGEEEADLPDSHGFDKSFALAASGADNWEDKSYLGYYPEAPWYEDGKRVSLPNDFYSSQLIVDKMIRYLNDSPDTEPFFAYLPFQAIHIPVQAPKEYVSKYEGQFDMGWEALKMSRHQKAQDLGLIPEGAPLSGWPENYRKWKSLSQSDRDVYAARMEVNAAMLEAMDFHIGRFVGYLKERKLFENTIFVITSDNGPEPSRGDNNLRLDLWMLLNGYNTGLEAIGQKGSWGFIGPEWAAAAATPGSLFKFYMTEGGIRAPLIIAGPGIDSGQIDSFAMVTDITPTLLEWIGIEKNNSAITGKSLMGVLKGAKRTTYQKDDFIVMEVSGNAVVYQGKFKVIRSVPPMGDNKWRLYDIEKDPGETLDLSIAKPETYASLLAHYEDYSSDLGVLKMPENYNMTDQILMNTENRMMERQLENLRSLALVFFVLMLTAWRLRS
mgnify:FL=1